MHVHHKTGPHKNCNHAHHHAHHLHDHHDHHHHHQPKNFNRAFFIGISLNIIFVLVEAFYGYLSHSLALIADAGHNLSDVLGLVIAWTSFWLVSKSPTARFTFGYRKSSILSALVNSLFLMVAVGIIIWEAIHRLKNPATINSSSVMIIATIGIFINAATALLFFKDKDHDINLKGAYLHMAADALISLGVVISAFVIQLTNWNWIDPVVCIAISLFIIYSTWDLLKNSLRLSLDAVPAKIDPEKVKLYLQKISGVVEVHDLHIWAMSTTETALTAHLSMQNTLLSNPQLTMINSDLKNMFDIHHATLQTELYDENFHCHLKPADSL